MGHHFFESYQENLPGPLKFHTEVKICTMKEFL
jgi:hypothetical protein